MMTWRFGRLLQQGHEPWKEEGIGEVGSAGGRPGTFHAQAVAGSFNGDLRPYLSDGC